MYTIDVKKATTDVTVYLRVIDSTDGTPETAVAYDTAGIDLWYMREGSDHVSITEATQTAGGAHSDGGFVHISDGICRLDLPDAACATGVDHVYVGGTVTGMIVIGLAINLVDYDPFDAVRMGMSALPNAAADAAGGLPISDAGGLDLDALNAAAVRLTAARAQVIDDWLNGGRLDLILDAAATAAALATSDGKLDTLVARLTAARAGYLDALNGHVAQTGDNYARIGVAGAGLTEAGGDGDHLTEAGGTGDQLTAITGALLNAAAVRAAVGLAAANLDTQLAALPTAAENRAEMDSNSTMLAAIAAYIDTEIAAIKAVTDNLPDSGALTTIAADAARLTAARAQVLTDLIDGGRLDLLIDAIKAKTDNLPEGVQKNAALSNFPVVMVLSSDHVTPATGKTVTGQRSIDGGAFAAVTGTITEVSNGLYQFDAEAADTNGDIIVWRFSNADCDDTWVHIKTEA